MSWSGGDAAWSRSLVRAMATAENGGPGSMDDVTSDADLAAIAEEYWEAKLAASPLLASFLGDHCFDDRADDVSAESEQRLRSVWVGLRDRAAAVATDGLSETDRDTRELSRSWTTTSGASTCGCGS